MFQSIYIRSGLLLFLSILLISGSPPEKKELDDRLFGTWQGSQKDQFQIGVESFWIQERFEDGKFMLLYTYTYEVNGKKKIEHGTEKGEWWVKNGVFYELHYSSGLTDTYTYDVLDSDRISFASKKLNVPIAVDVYRFIDYRVPDA